MGSLLKSKIAQNFIMNFKEIIVNDIVIVEQK